MQEGIVNIKLIHFPIYFNSNRKKKLDSGELNHRREGLIVVNTLFLSTLSNNKSSFLSFNRTIRFVFNLIDPFTRNRLLVSRKRDKIPIMIILKSLEFLKHGILPSKMKNSMLISLRFMYGEFNRGNLGYRTADVIRQISGSGGNPEGYPSRRRNVRSIYKRIKHGRRNR